MKYFNAKVEVVQTRTLSLQVAADDEAGAMAKARQRAQAESPGFVTTNVQLELVAESDIAQGSRVVHRLFGAGVVEALESNGPKAGFRATVRFDRGDTKAIHSDFVKPELLQDGPDA